MSTNREEKPTKILFLTTELRPGGAEKCLVNLACGIDRNRFEPYFVSIRSRPDARESRLLKQLEANSVETEFLNCDSVWSGWKAFSRLKKIIAEHNVKIVQSFLFHANVMAGWVLRNFPQTKLFTGIRVADPSRLRQRIEQWATSRASKFIAVSDTVRKFAVESMKLPGEKVVAIPNGVAEPRLNERFEAGNLGIQNRYVVFVGRLEPQKGLVEFLQELQQQDSQLPEFDLVFVGEGSLRTKLNSIAEKMQRQCYFPGWQASPQNLVANADLLVLPSKWEGMPNVLLETMALGKCFLAFAVDGVCDLVDPDDLQLVQPENYQQFFDRLKQLLNQPNLRTEIGAANQARIERNFSEKKMIASYERIYLNDLPLLT